MSDVVQTPEEFVQTAAQFLAAQPAIEVVGADDLTLYLRINGYNVTNDVAAFYNAYRAAPDQLPSVLQTLFETVAETPPDRSEDDPAVLLERVMPMLKPVALLDEVRQWQLPMLAWRSFAADLIVTYVVDEGESIVYLYADHLRRWGIDEPTLYRRALTNLRAKPWRPEPGLLGVGQDALIIFNSRDGYDATRLLLPEVLSAFATTVSGNLVIGVPSRDFLIAFSDASPRVYLQIKAQIENDARTQPNALTGQLFTLQNGQLRVYPAPENA